MQVNTRNSTQIYGEINSISAKSSGGGGHTEVGVGVEVVVGAGLVAANHLLRRLLRLPLRPDALLHLHLHPLRLLVGVKPQPRRRRLRQAAVGVAVAALAPIHLPLSPSAPVVFRWRAAKQGRRES